LHRKTLAIGGRKRSYIICKLEKTVYFRKIIKNNRKIKIIDYFGK